MITTERSRHAPATLRLLLDQEEADALRSVLDRSLRDLSMEIADTDLPEYRHRLRRQRESLESVLDLVGGPIPNAERFRA